MNTFGITDYRLQNKTTVPVLNIKHQIGIYQTMSIVLISFSPLKILDNIDAPRIMGSQVSC